MDRDILAGVPPQMFSAIKGQFNTAAIENAISRCDEFVMPDTEKYEGTVVYDWGPEVNLDEGLMPPAFDNLGRGGAMAVQENYVFRQLNVEAVEVMIDLSQGREGKLEREGVGLLGVTSLADSGGYSLMATALSEMGAYSIYLTDRVLTRRYYLEIVLELLGLDPQETEELRRGIETEPAESLLGTYRTYATGIGQDEEGAFMTVVLVYDSPEEARSDVPVLEQRIETGTTLWTGEPWRDRIDSYEIWADGRTLRGTLRGQIVRNWLDIVYQRDILLLGR